MSEEFEFDPKAIGAGVHIVADGRVVLFVDENGNAKAANNRCRHMGGRFRKDHECQLICPRHGWTLDASRMEYTNPNGIRQQELSIERLNNGNLNVRGIDSCESALGTDCAAQEETRAPLQANEWSLRFYAHACMELITQDARVFTDPWLKGPAFTRGWWLTQTPPSDWLERLSTANAIYISHNHSDHLNVHTLADLHSKSPDVRIIVPAFESGSCERLVRKLGFRNVDVTAFDSWVSIGKMDMMIVRDETDRDDSALLARYKGHYVLNTVDCRNLASRSLPHVDVLLSSFAGGASGYPVCWEELYGKDRVDQIVRRNIGGERRHVFELIEATQPQVYVPFAGYFTEAHPSDHAIKRSNYKNDPKELCDQIQQRFSGITAWVPSPGETLDIGTKKVTRAVNAHSQHPSHDFAIYTDEIARDLEFPPLHSLKGVQRYFDWAGYRGDLILHILETNESFAQTMREYWIDFRIGQLSTTPPSRTDKNGNTTNYLRMRVRADVFRHVLRHGLSWEEISIGFQARFYREPDIYNFAFWNHFQNFLPTNPPDFQNNNANTTHAEVSHGTR